MLDPLSSEISQLLGGVDNNAWLSFLSRDLSSESKSQSYLEVNFSVDILTKHRGQSSQIKVFFSEKTLAKKTSQLSKGGHACHDGHSP